MSRSWAWVLVVVMVGCGSEAISDGGTDAPDTGCVMDRDCDDGLFCTGEESCSPGASGGDARGCVAGAPPCADSTCDEGTDACSTGCATPDADGDGSDSIPCGGLDCDDTDAARAPGRTEVCDPDDVDEDCDPTTFGARDVDDDGAFDAACCNGTGSARQCGTDCDDARPGVGPTSPEVCNDRDDDCDGAIDEDVLLTCFTDADSDRYAPASATSTVACTCPVRTTDMAPEGDLVDCDDARADVSPGSPEICGNGRDDDCDGTIDEAGNDWYADCDGDGYGAGTPVRQCTSPGRPPGCTATGAGSVLVGGDCDDTVVDVHPNASERCDGTIDHDCDGAVDEAADADAWCNDASRALPHAVAACTSGECRVASCVAPFLDCSSAPGCELDGSADPTNCGECGHTCTWNLCADSTCEPRSIALATTTSRGLLATGQTAWGGTAPTGTGIVQISAQCELSASGVVTCSSRSPGYTDVVEIAGACGSGGGPYSGTGCDCARRASGEVWCWTSGSLPARITGLVAPIAITVGNDFGCAIESDRTVSCWGSNAQGQLGDPTMPTRSTAGPVPGLTDVVEVQTGRAARHVCARHGSGAVTCWGANDYGQLGSTRTTRTPMAVPGITDAVSIAVGPDHTCAVRATGEVLCWGSNGSGELGHCGGSTETPTPVTGITDGLRVYAGAEGFVRLTCVQTRTGPFCFGENNYYNLGDGTYMNRCSPVAVLPPL